MKIIYAIATLSGTIIGAGLFALPYITLQVGFWVILFYFLILGGLVTLLHLFFGELAIKTPDFKRLPGFAKMYLGNRGRSVAYTSGIIGMFGSLLAYLILGGTFLKELVPSEASIIPYTLFYFAVGAALIFFGIKAIEKIQFWGMILFLLILFILFLEGLPRIDINNLFIAQAFFSESREASNWTYLFLPYGVIIFSLWGVSLIPEIEEILAGKKEKLLKIIPIAILLPALVYLFFIFVVLGMMGEHTEEEALIGLRAFFGSGIGVTAIIFGLLTTFTSFLTLGLTLKKVFWYDLKLPKNLAWAITCFVPLSLFLIGLRDFINVIWFMGAVMMAVDGILILLMYKKSLLGSRITGAVKIKALAVYPLIGLLGGGIIYVVVVDLVPFLRELLS